MKPPDRLFLLYLALNDSTNRLTEEQISLWQADPLLSEPPDSPLALSDVGKRLVVTGGTGSITMGRIFALIQGTARDSPGSGRRWWVVKLGTNPLRLPSATTLEL